MSYTLFDRSFTKSSDGLVNSSAISRLRALTYFISSALLAMEPRSKDGLVSFSSFGRSVLSTSRRSRTRNGFESILFGASMSM